MKLTKDSYVMSPIKCLCPESLIDDDELEDTIEFSRIFGVGIYELFIAIIIWNYGYLENRFTK